MLCGSMVDDRPSGSRLLRLRSGFRLRAGTPAKRLNFDSALQSVGAENILVALRSELVTFLGLLLKRHVILINGRPALPQLPVRSATAQKPHETPSRTPQSECERGEGPAPLLPGVSQEKPHQSRLP